MATPIADGTPSEGFLHYFRKAQRVREEFGDDTAYATIREDLRSNGLSKQLADAVANDILKGDPDSFRQVVSGDDEERDFPADDEEDDEDATAKDCGCGRGTDCSCQDSNEPEDAAEPEDSNPINRARKAARRPSPRNEMRVFKARDGVTIYGPASVAVVDDENDLIKGDALRAALPQLLKRARFSLQHTDIIPGEILESWEAKDGTVYKTEVRAVTPSDLQRFDLLKDADVEPGTEALFVVGKIYTDDEIGRDIAEKILKGDLRAFSISGQAVQSQQTTDCSGFTCKLVNEIEKISLSAVTICDRGMNQGAGFDVIAKTENGMRVSDGEESYRFFWNDDDEEPDKQDGDEDVEEYEDALATVDKALDDLLNDEDGADADEEADSDDEKEEEEGKEMKRRLERLDETGRDDEDEHRSHDDVIEDETSKAAILDGIAFKDAIACGSLADYLYEASIDLQKGNVDRAGLAIARLKRDDALVKDHVDAMRREERRDVHDALDDFQEYMRAFERNVSADDIAWLESAVDVISDLDEHVADSYDEHAAHRDKTLKELQTLVKDRTYVDDPSDAPEGADVQQGPRGGYYYDESAESGGDEPHGEGDPHDGGDPGGEGGGARFPEVREMLGREPDYEKIEEIFEIKPEALRDVIETVESHGYGGTSDYARVLDRKDMNTLPGYRNALARELAHPSGDRYFRDTGEHKMKSLGSEVMRQRPTYGQNRGSDDSGSFRGFPLDYPARPTAASSAHVARADASSQKPQLGDVEDYLYPAGSDRTEDSANDDDDTAGTRPRGFAMKEYENQLDDVLAKDDEDEDSEEYGACPRHEDGCPEDCEHRDDGDVAAMSKTLDELHAASEWRAKRHAMLRQFTKKPSHERVASMYKGTLGMIRGKDRDDTRFEQEDEDDYEDRRLDETDDVNEHEGSAADKDGIFNGLDQQMAQDKQRREQRAADSPRDRDGDGGDVPVDEHVANPKEAHECVESLRDEGHDEESAWAICQHQQKSADAHGVSHVHSDAFVRALNEIPRSQARRVDHRLTKTDDPSLAAHMLAFAALGGEVFEEEWNEQCSACFKMYQEFDNPDRVFDAMKHSLDGNIDASMLPEQDYLEFKDTFPIVYEQLTGNAMPRGMIP